MAKLSDMGEMWLVEQIVESLPRGARPGEGPGDDAAVVYPESGPPWLFCIDTVTEGVHFRPDVSSPNDVGWKAVAVNLSDVAAMGGSPSLAVVSVCAPSYTETEAVSEIVAGAGDCAGRFGARVAGGDTTESPVLSVTAAVLGRMPEGVGPVLRTGARPGDAVLVTGCLGEAEAGRRAALAGRDLESPAVRRHRRPIPRLAEGVRAARLGATSMIDVSDGLVLDARRLAKASGCRLAIDLTRIPVACDTNEAGSLALALAGGEDFEVLFTAGREAIESLLEQWGEGLTPVRVIGEVSEGAGVELFPQEMVPEDLEAGGWEHFRPAGPG